MTFPPERAAATSLHDGQTVYFCSADCKRRFDAEPGRYLPADGDSAGRSAVPSTAQPAAPSRQRPKSRPRATPGGAAAAAVVRHPRATPSPAPPGETLFTCPMHPQVQQRGPGICPKCGMALEPSGVPVPSPAPSGPARCTRRSCATAPATARSAAWRSSRARSTPRRRRTPSSST
ncbi:MAG TPA: heavy metal-binding domain-containing protein [Thermoanaerobaculia bacterium]|nr:heavy metal-binding domain-containing protein [Thermoanaerobaculia bacterium]